MISVYHWNADQNTGCWLKPDDFQKRAEQLRTEPGVLWIDLEHPEVEEEQLVYQRFFQVHPLTLEDITRLQREPDEPPHFPKVEEFPEYLFVIVTPLTERVLGRVHRKVTHALITDGRACTQLSAILTKKILITHHFEPVSSTQELRSFLLKHESKAERGPDYLFHLILDAMVDQYAPILDRLDDSLEAIETEVFEKPTQRLLLTLVQLKHEIIVLRKTLIYEREILARLCRGEFALIETREMAYYRNVYDHLVRFTELIESSREMVSDLMQTHLSATSNKLNEVMKVLTMISTVVLPMTLIAGIYGMNFKHMPELESVWGYPFALGLMALTAAAAFTFFRWKKWL